MRNRYVKWGCFRYVQLFRVRDTRRAIHALGGDQRGCSFPDSIPKKQRCRPRHHHHRGATEAAGSAWASGRQWCYCYWQQYEQSYWYQQSYW